MCKKSHKQRKSKMKKYKISKNCKIHSQKMFCIIISLLLLASIALGTVLPASAKSTADCVEDSAECATHSALRALRQTKKSQKSENTSDGRKVLVGGMPFGIKFKTCGVTVVGFSDTADQKGASSTSSFPRA